MSSNLKVNTILPSSGTTVTISGISSVTSSISAGSSITATTFYGSGANLTGITQTTINNNADNRLITGSGTANTLEGEANLTFDGTNLDLGDGKYVRLGASNDFQMWHHSGGNSYIKETGGGALVINADDFYLQNNATTTYLRTHSGGAIDLNFGGNKKFETTNTGAVITGICTATSFSGDGSNLTGVTQVGGASSVTFNDSVAANFGTDRDLEIYHNGTHAVISNTTGNLHIKDNSIKLQDESANQMIVATGGQGVQLYNNASLKFSTTAHGIVVEDDNPYIVIKDNDTASGTGIVGWIEAQDSSGNSVWKIGNTHNDQNTLWINQRHNASTKFTGAVSGDTWEIYGNSGHFTPCTDNTFDIGESGRRVRNIYTADLHCSNRGSSNDVDGTWGDYTIQEGESDLFLINNRSGKKYKFNLTEVN